MEVVISRQHSAGSAEVDDKDKKRKGSNRIILSDDDDKESHAISTIKSSGSIPPPRKKKKLEVEIVNNSLEHSTGSSEVDNKGRNRKGSKRVIESDDDGNYVGAKSNSDEEEVDERIVEESLSDIQRPRLPLKPTYHQEEEGPSTSPVRAQSPAYIRQDTPEERSPTLSRPRHEMKKTMDSLPTVLASTSSKPDPLNKKRTRPSSLSASPTVTESHATTKVTSRSTARPKKRMKTATLSTQEWEELNDFQSYQVTDSGMVPGHDKSEKGILEKLPELDSADMNLNHPVVEEFHPPSPSERSMPAQASRSRAESSGSHSLSGRGTKSISPPRSRSKEVGSPGPLATSPTSIAMPTPPLRKGSGTNGEEPCHMSPTLSPRAKERLAIFDRAMMEIELGKGKEQRSDDGDKAKKSRGRRLEGGKDVVAGGGGQENGFRRRSEKNWNGNDKEQTKEDKARTSTPRPPEIKKRKNSEPSDVSDSQDKPVRRPKDSVGSGGSQGVEVDLAVESNNIDVDTQTTGIFEPQLDPIPLRQEEEESTQDLELELLLYQRQQGVGVERSGGLVPEIKIDTGHLPAIQIDSQPISEEVLETSVQNRGAGNNEKSDRFLDEIPSVCIIYIVYRNPFFVNALVQIIVENPSRASISRPHSSLEDGDELANRKTGSRTFKSRSRSHSVSSQQNKNDESDPEAVIPPTASTHRETLQEPSQSVSQVNIFRSFLSTHHLPTRQSSENPHYLGAAMHLLNTKSEEISKLEDQLSAEKRKNKDLLQQISAFQLRLTEPTNATPSTSEVLEQELAQARAQLALQTTSWKIDRAALILEIETATKAKVSAENDRDFFREQYATASGFVSSVRDENAELEKRIMIATDQSQSGVRMVKSTYDLRMKTLERDVHAWRRMAELMVEKDRRTNDDIRSRAAEEPELRARCDRQKITLEETSKRLLRLEEDLEETEKTLLEEKAFGKRWQEMTVKLNLELNEALTKLERIGKIGIGDGDESNGHEFVYRCQWRPDDLNACEAVFLNISVCIIQFLLLFQ